MIALEKPGKRPGMTPRAQPNYFVLRSEKARYLCASQFQTDINGRIVGETKHSPLHRHKYKRLVAGAKCLICGHKASRREAP